MGLPMVGEVGPGLPALEMAAGSVMGGEHRRCDRGSQDGLATVRGERALVAVVTDGCGSGAHSEVGALVGARLVAHALSRRLEGGASVADPLLWKRVESDVLTHLGLLAAAMGGELRDTVASHLLFTVVGAAVTPTLACAFAIGDGVIAVNGEQRELGPFPDNKPPYLGYALLDRGNGRPFEVGFSLEAIIPTAELESIVVATDGAVELARRSAPLPQLVGEDRLFRNRDALRRKLSLLSRERLEVDWEERCLDRAGGLLPDDTTVVVIRRSRAS